MTKQDRITIAENWHNHMLTDYKDSINACIAKTIAYDSYTEQKQTDKPKFIINDIDSTTAIFTYQSDKMCVMNFASYTRPGGGFLDGSIAQEEALCLSSFLYEVISAHTQWYDYNNQHKNRGLYEHRCLYSSDVQFFCKDKSKSVDVITVACPNHAVLSYNPKAFTKTENNQAVYERLQLVKYVCEKNNIDTLIAGAWGCGVFQQDPHYIAQIFKKVFNTSSIKNIIFAIPGGRNYVIFKSYF